MRSLLLGAFIFASFGLTANAAEPSDAKAVGHHARRLACHWVTADGTLRLLRDILPGERRIATERPVSRPVSPPIKEPIVKASRPVTPVHVASRPAPARVVGRAEPSRLLSRAEPVARGLAQHVSSLVVGVGFYSTLLLPGRVHRAASGGGSQSLANRFCLGWRNRAGRRLAGARRRVGRESRQAP
jgi:hypothetical protein